MDQLEQLVLETLSFYEPMTVEQIVMDLDTGRQAQFPDLTLEEMKEAVERLVEKKALKMIPGENISYLRLMPKRKSWLRRVWERFTR